MATSTVTVTLKDDNGVALAGKSVALAAGSGSSVITTSPATTNGSGVATFTVTDTTAQAVTYTATDTTDSLVLNGGGQTPTVTFTAPKASVANSTVSASPVTLEADGLVNSTVTVALKDDHGVALAGKSVSLAARFGSLGHHGHSGHHQQLRGGNLHPHRHLRRGGRLHRHRYHRRGDPQRCRTDPDGDLHHAEGQRDDLDGGGVTDVGGGRRGGHSTVTVTLEDDNGVAPGRQVGVLVAASGSSVITTSPAITNSSGVATFTVTDTTAQAVTYTATDTTDAVSLNGGRQSPTVIFASPQASSPDRPSTHLRRRWRRTVPPRRSPSPSRTTTACSWPGSRSPWPPVRALR